MCHFISTGCANVLEYAMRTCEPFDGVVAGMTAKHVGPLGGYTLLSSESMFQGCWPRLNINCGFDVMETLNLDEPFMMMM